MTHLHKNLPHKPNTIQGIDGERDGDPAVQKRKSKTTVESLHTTRGKRDPPTIQEKLVQERDPPSKESEGKKSGGIDSNKNDIDKKKTTDSAIKSQIAVRSEFFF